VKISPCMWADRESVGIFSSKPQLLLGELFTFEFEDKARYCGDRRTNHVRCSTRKASSNHCHILFNACSGCKVLRNQQSEIG
jgi:hypothetical protein